MPSRAIVEIARLHPDFRVIFKTKKRRLKETQNLSMLDADGEPLPPNLSVVAGGDPFKLLTESHVVAGFNTTALLEAIAAGKPVIVPRFGEACDDAMRDHIIDLGAAVDYADSPEQLIEMLSHYAEQREEIPSELTSSAAQALNYWVGNDDGQAGRRVLEAVRAEIQH